ncbi:MAG: protein kinase [Acidobacteriaceae bacterium]|nr:protein kinase [Acidobacteriaceae bacterium]MBV9498298.1 protein kinase [Acidobacteriaceae bacterium]
MSSKKVKNRYQLKERLGTGGMGIVYRARDVVINADVALKTLTDITDPVALRMFREECDKLAKIVHPNVVEIRDVGEIEEGGARKPYLVMPFLRGKTLDSLIVDSPGGLPLERALEILIQASRGLQATHEAGLIHRDIKPSNIFVLEDDSVKLIDFGVAHYAEGLLTATRKGTLMYMAPEQVMMRGTSPLSDIFSLGVVGYETLTGRRPFKARTEKELIDGIVHRNPPPASRFNSQLNSAVDQTLQKALAKLPEHRFRSAREFGDTLRKAALNQPIGIFDPARIDARIEQARGAIARGDLELAGDILNQLELQGWLDERISEVKQSFERLRDQRTLSSLLASARLRIEAQEYTLAAKKVEEALRLDPQNAEAEALRQEIDHYRAECDVAERLATARRFAGNREFCDAKEAVEQALEIWPNEPAALELRSSIQRGEQEYSAVLSEKQRAVRRAEQAMNDCDPARAWEAIQHALDLDRQAPEPGNATSDLLNLSNRILAASQDAQRSLERARELCRVGELNGALTCCDEALARLPEHADLRALKLDIQEAQQEHVAHLIAATEREIEAQPNLDRRIDLLKAASERFPQVEHFASSYRAACEKRDFAESLAIKARTAEREHCLADALEEWNRVRSVHPDYPGLDAEIGRLRQSKKLQADYEGHEDLLCQIRTAIAACEFAGALHLIQAAAPGFEGDSELAELRAAADDGIECERRTGHLLESAAQLAKDGCYDEALSNLDEACAQNVRAREIAAARHHVLVEQARSLFDTDWRGAEALLKRALELAPGRDTVYKLLEMVEDRSRRERITEATDRIRQLETTHDFDGALRAAEQALAENPGDPELAQTAARLRQRGDRLQQAGQPSPTPDTSPGRVFLHAAWEKASAMAHRSWGNSGAARQRLMASSPTRDESTGGGIAFAEKTTSNAGTPSTPHPEIRPSFFGLARPPRIKGVLLAFIGGTVGLAILLALMLPRRNSHVAIAPHKPAIAPHTPVLAPQSPVLTTKLALRLAPVDAQVTVDGSSASLRDGMLTVSPGTHLIEARSPGYKPFSRSVNIAARDNAPLDVALVPVPLPPALHIETDLQSGSVLIDGKRAGGLEGGQFSQHAPDGSHTFAVLAPSGGRYSFAFTLGQDPVWSLDVPKSSAYGTPALAALAGTGARIVCGRPGLAFELDGGRPSPCTAAGKNLPPLSNGHHTLTLLDGSRKVAVHTLDYQGTPILTALITTGAQFGGLAIQGTEDTFDVSVNGYTSKRPAKEGHWRRLLRPGDYSIAISKPGFQANPSTLNISVAPGVDTLEQVAFTPVPVRARLRLQSQPGTEVSLNGKSAGTVPESGTLELPQLPVGSAELHLHHKGFADAQQTITLEKGENQRTILLQELKAKLTWSLDPPNAQASYSTPGSSVRHSLTGDAIEVPPGTYNFEASAPGRVPASSTVTVAAGETKNVPLRLDAASPTFRTVDVWPGWESQSGWLVREKPGPIFHTLPEHASRVAFSTQWERQKTLVHWFGGSLNLVFRTSDAARSISFRITEHGISWNARVHGEHQEGKIPLNLAKNSERIQADIRPSGVALTINGTALAAIGPNLYSESNPVQFGFIIEQDQVVRLTGIRIATQTAAPN